MMRTLLIFPLILSVAVFSATADPTNSVYWDFAATASPAFNAFDDLNASEVSRGNNDSGPSALLNDTSGSSSYTTAAGFAASGGTNAVASGTPGTFDISTSTYFGVDLSLKPLAMYSLIVNDVSLGTRSTTSGPNTLLLYASTDDFVSDFESLGSILVSANGNWAATQFSGLSYVINPGDTLSLRLYGAGGTGTSSKGNWRIDDLAVTLTPTPEPSSIALAALGGLICVGFLRRRAF